MATAEVAAAAPTAENAATDGNGGADEDTPEQADGQTPAIEDQSGEFSPTSPAAEDSSGQVDNETPPTGDEADQSGPGAEPSGEVPPDGLPTTGTLAETAVEGGVIWAALVLAFALLGAGFAALRNRGPWQK